MIAALLLAAATPVAAKVDVVASGAGLAGEVLVAKGERILLDHAYGTIDPAGGVKHRAGERWRLASVTKQVTAVQIVQRMAASLDLPLAEQAQFRDLRLGKLTMRQLLTHHSGLANPDDTKPDGTGVPSFYASLNPDYRYCASKPAGPGRPFAYNNCDYVIASARSVASDRPKAGDWPDGMALAKPSERGVPGFVHGKPEPASFQLASWGAAGGLIGTAPALLAFDRALMTGKLLPSAALAELWTPEGHGSYQALGQWVFPGTLKDCATPKHIVQRDGEIYGVQVRNFIFPDDDLVVILFTNRSADDFPLGEVWEGQGFVYDLLSAAACG